MARKVYRIHVTVGAEPKTWHGMTGEPLHVEAVRVGHGSHRVEAWYEHDDDVPEVDRTFVVVGTGQPIPDGYRYRGTTARTPDGFVWHLYELEKR